VTISATVIWVTVTDARQCSNNRNSIRKLREPDQFTEAISIMVLLTFVDEIEIG
jgi:hypothetical protein